MNLKPIDHYLEQMEADTPVPAGLSERIMKAVDKRARVLEKRQLFWSSIQLSLGVTAAIYGFTATVLNFLNADLVSYFGVVSENPALLATSDGLLALLEQIPRSE